MANWKHAQHKYRQDLKGDQIGFLDSKYGSAPSPGKVGFEVVLAQAPEGGIPARVGITPGSAACTEVIVAPLGGTGFSAGDLVKTDKTFTVLNWDFQIHAADGDRVFQVSKTEDHAQMKRIRMKFCSMSLSGLWAWASRGSQ